MHYRGICRCGNAAFEVDGEDAGLAASAHAANRGAGAALWSIPRDRLRLLGALAGIGAYTCSKQLIGHRFCGTCGTHLYGEEIVEGDGRMVYVNLDCLVPAEAATEATPDSPHSVEPDAAALQT